MRASHAERRAAELAEFAHSVLAPGLVRYKEGVREAFGAFAALGGEVEELRAEFEELAEHLPAGERAHPRAVALAELLRQKDLRGQRLLPQLKLLLAGHEKQLQTAAFDFAAEFVVQEVRWLRSFQYDADRLITARDPEKTPPLRSEELLKGLELPHASFLARLRARGTTSPGAPIGEESREDEYVLRRLLDDQQLHPAEAVELVAVVDDPQREGPLLAVLLGSNPPRTIFSKENFALLSVRVIGKLLVRLGAQNRYDEAARLLLFAQRLHCREKRGASGAEFVEKQPLVADWRLWATVIVEVVRAGPPGPSALAARLALANLQSAIRLLAPPDFDLLAREVAAADYGLTLAEIYFSVGSGRPASGSKLFATAEEIEQRKSKFSIFS